MESQGHLFRAMPRARRRTSAFARELAGSARQAADLASFLTLARDIVGYRAMRLIDPGRRSPRTVRLAGGARLTYRLNWGDVRAIAETWFEGAYELPVELRARNILDLGANIGATAVWLASRYGPARVVAVEAAPANAALARRNLAANDIEGEVIEAAVGPEDGTAHFAVSPSSTLGRVSDDGIEVAMVSPGSLVEHFPAGQTIDIVKMDIEGSENAVLGAPLGWLDHVRCLVVEFHDGRTEAERLAGRLTEAGFVPRELAARTGYMGPDDVMLAFTRPETAAVP